MGYIAICDRVTQAVWDRVTQEWLGKKKNKIKANFAFQMGFPTRWFSKGHGLKPTEC